MIEGSREYWADQCQRFQRELEKVIKQRDAARAVLAELEWEPYFSIAGSFYRCPKCHARKDNGHDDDCALHAALLGHRVPMTTKEALLATCDAVHMLIRWVMTNTECVPPEVAFGLGAIEKAEEVLPNES